MSDNNTLLGNPELECSVLASCITSPEAFASVQEVLVRDDFSGAYNRQLWKIICSLYEKSEIIDNIQVLDEMNRYELYDNIDSRAYLEKLYEHKTSSFTAEHSAKLIHDYGRRKRLSLMSENVLSSVRNLNITADEIADEIEQALYNENNINNSARPVSIQEALPGVIEDIRYGAENLTGYSSGFSDLDALISGFKPGSLNVIAARPSMGKTALAMNIAQFGGDGRNLPVLIFSLEMTKEQLIQRMLAAESRVSVSDIYNGRVSDYDFMKVIEARELLSSRNIFFMDKSDLSAADFRTSCRRFFRKHKNTGLIIVDYIQLMRSGNKRSENRTNEVSEISRSLKASAVELNCPVIALSQLSRETEKRADRKPQLWDLRDSGAIEQDADTVIMIYRDSYYGSNENNSLINDTAEIRVAKNRHGATGTCRLIFQREYTKFAGYIDDVVSE